MALQQHHSDLAGPPAGESVPLASGDDRPFHQDVPLTREDIDLPDTGTRSQVRQEDPDIGEMDRACLSHRVARVEHLEQDVDERAALEVIPLEPFVEDVEDGKQLRRWAGCTQLDLGL